MKRYLLAAILAAAPAFAETTTSLEGARVHFVNLEDGAIVSSPVEVVLALEGMALAPAGTEEHGTGHHILLINRPPLGEGEDGANELRNSLPFDENHVHLADGETEIMLELPPGTHTLQLVLGDHNHIPHDPPVVEDVITITVE